MYSEYSKAASRIGFLFPTLTDVSLVVVVVAPGRRTTARLGNL